MARISRELQAKGIDVISLSIGEPDFNTPDFIKEAAKKAIDDNFSHYTPVPGYLDLREAICTKFKRDNGLTYTPDEIVVSTGAKQSIANVILALVDKDDEVIIPTPYWVSYSEQVKLAEGKVVFIPSTVESNFKISAEQLEKAITPKTKLMIFSTPCNPSGTVYTKSELEKFAAVIAAHPEMFVISDEIYEHINFIGKHESLAQFENVRNQVITVNGVSKGFAMTGWRIGYIGAPKWIAKGCEKMQGQFTSGTSSIAQKAAIAAVLADPSVTHEMCAAFKKRRDLVMRLLKEIQGVKASVPDGAFYVFPDISFYFGKKFGDTVITNSYELSMYLLHHANVALVSGDAFGDDNCIRFSYATSEAKLTEALTRVKTALANLN
jgi:aspartate aminotransferase